MSRLDEEPPPPEGWPPPHEASVGEILRSGWVAAPGSSRPTGIMLLSHFGVVVLAIGIVSAGIASMIIFR